MSIHPNQLYTIVPVEAAERIKIQPEFIRLR